jgi:glutamine amidotransferase
MSFLRTTDADAALEQFATTGKPLLGICLGMQLLFDRSTEFGDTHGLGLIRGEVEELQKIEQPSKDWKVPNVGWRGLKSILDKPDHLLLGLPKDAEFYFTHSFSATRLEAGDVLATTRWSNADLVAVVRRDNLWGTQFHPEKSGLHGLQILRNFLSA